MKTPTELLIFALRFARMDLLALRRAAWSKLKDEIVAFSGLGGPRPQIVNLRPGEPTIHLAGTDFQSSQQMSEEYVKQLQITVKNLVAPSSLKKYESGARSLLVNPEDYLQVTLRCSPTILGVMDRHSFFFSGTVRDLFVIRLLVLLLQMPADKIRRCPSCDKVFVRIRKQRYCSKTCTDRVAKQKERRQGQKQLRDRKKP